MLDVKKINLSYGSSQILFDVSIKAKKGNITCLMGSNGVGKTSLLKFLSFNNLLVYESSIGFFFLVLARLTSSSRTLSILNSNRNPF